MGKADFGSFNSTYASGLVNKYATDLQFGKSVKAGIFDEGAIRDSLAEFMEGKDSRVTVITKKSQSDHATEVAIVMAAKGPNPLSLGIAWDLRMLSFDADSDLKDLAAYADKINISNHSYVTKAGWWIDPTTGGYLWLGGLDEADDARYGKYDEKDGELDRILRERPQLISFAAAGNARGYIPPAQPIEHWAWVAEPAPGHWDQSTKVRRPDTTNRGGLDTIAGLGLGKNVICVGAIQQVYGPDDPYTIAAFSSLGPADDGRVKPDVVAAGQRVWVRRQSDGVVAPVDGTSFASPTVAGVSALLVELFKVKMEQAPRSDEMRALLVHTARDEGPLGPDPMFGWGVVNAVRAGDLLARQEDPGRHVIRGEVAAGQTKTFKYVRPESTQQRIRATLAWIDPPGPANRGPLNDPTPSLVNDLDLEVEAPDETLFYPYRLDRADPLREARIDARNRVDNVEVVDAHSGEVADADPSRGEWTIRVTGAHLGEGSSQAFALIVSALPDIRPPGGGPPIRRSRPKASRPLEIVAAALPTPGDVRPATGRAWRFLGPHDLGGRTWALAADPTDPRKIWAGCASGGVWQTNDAGGSWSLGSDPFLASLPVCSLVLDPRNPRVIYAGTGEGTYSPAARRGAGIFKSTDGGASWTQLTATTGSGFSFVNRLAISGDGRSLLAATRNGLFRSTDAGESFSAIEALNDVDTLDVDFHPTDPLTCLASGRGRAFRSTDGGLTWAKLTDLPTSSTGGEMTGGIIFTFARANPDVVYASVDRNGGELYRSADRGKTFRLRNVGENYLAGEGWYNHTIWAGDPKDAGLVVVGGFDLYRSTNGGASWTQISEWWRDPLSPPAHHHTIISSSNYDATSRPTVYVGGDGGISRADNIREVSVSAGWQRLNRGYAATPFTGAAGNPTGGVIVAGTEHSGTLVLRQRDGRLEWATMFGGSGGFCSADPSDPDFLYGEYIYLQIHRSTDGGRSASFISEGIADAGDYSKANWLAPFLLDPNDPNTLLAGGTDLWRSRDVKQTRPTWASIKPGAKVPISAIAVARGKSNIIWVGHNDGAIYRTSDGLQESPKWSLLGTGESPLPAKYCTRIVIDPTNPDVVYLTYGGSTGGNLWKTADDGKTFRKLGESLPQVPIHCMAIHPDNPRLLYVGNEVGIFASDDGGETWAATNSGPANIPVRELFWMGKTLVAATNGRGMFQIDLSDLNR